MTYSVNASILCDTLCSTNPDIKPALKAVILSTCIADASTTALTQLPEEERTQELTQATSTAYLVCHISISETNGHPSFDPNSLGSATKSPIGTFLVPILKGPKIHLMVLSCPCSPPTDETRKHPTTTTLMGATGESVFTRTNSFNGTAITTGYSTFTMLSYSGTSLQLHCPSHLPPPLWP